MNAVKRIKRIGIIALATASILVALIGLTRIMIGDLRAQGFKATGIIRFPVACKSFDGIKLDLNAKFGEVQAFAAATYGGAALTIFVSPKGGWTAVLLRPGQPACVLMSGAPWSWRPPMEPET